MEIAESLMEMDGPKQPSYMISICCHSVKARCGLYVGASIAKTRKGYGCQVHVAMENGGVRRLRRMHAYKYTVYTCSTGLGGEAA